jgi:hypothetical protein
MTFRPAQLELALKLLDPLSDWGRFERLARAFLASEYKSFRTMASSTGDKGRDGELVGVPEAPRTLFQISAQVDWKSKLRETISTIRKNFPDTFAIIFASSQEIGAKGDDIKAEARRNGLALDILDRSWFVDRVNESANRSAAAREFYSAIVPAKIDLAEITQPTVASLTTRESRTLLSFLELQRLDEDAEKGLTRSCFEALIRAALRDTSAEKRISRAELYKRIAALLHRTELGDALPKIEGALSRLVRKTVRYSKKEDEFHLAFEEQAELIRKAGVIEALRLDYLADIDSIITFDAAIPKEHAEPVRDAVSRVIEAYLHNRGEQFALAVMQGGRLLDSDSELMNVTMSATLPGYDKKSNIVTTCYSVARTVLRDPQARTLKYLKLLSDSYTLFHFLALTPDIQKLSQQLFSAGELWLDTSAILPSLAEYADRDPDNNLGGPFSRLFVALSKAGIKLYVTRGVIEELVGHINRCRSYARIVNTTGWTGTVPYVAARYSIGHNISGFPDFSREFFDPNDRAENDFAMFFEEEFGITVHDTEDPSKLPEEARNEIVAYWQYTAERRTDLDEMLRGKLAAHDAENYMNVMLRRSDGNQDSWLGYRSWLLTLDRSAYLLLNRVSREAKGVIGHQPVMSLDFLTRYVSFGPLRSKIDQSAVSPLEMFAPEVMEQLPENLAEVAESVRKASVGFSERVTLRRIRHELDRQRAEYGIIHTAGLTKAPDFMKEI